MVCSVCVNETLFQSTLPHGERLISILTILSVLSFNPRSHMGSDHRQGGRGLHTEVSIHAPTWGATDLCSRGGNGTGFQSTLPHGERLPSLIRLHCQIVSIHAPTWGATLCGCFFKSLTRVSIHAPTWGATPLRAVWDSVFIVSIHAPTWGATHLSLTTTGGAVFQSTLPHGERLLFRTAAPPPQTFQSTLPHGERLITVCAQIQSAKFQSTLPHGERLSACAYRH